MAAIDKAALALTQCWKCLGCERMNDESFRGDNTCQSYRKADIDVLIERRYGSSEEYEQGEIGHIDNWRPNSTAQKAR